MTTRPLTHDDPLDDFDHRDIILLGRKQRVYTMGSGPAVIVMTEMPGISPHVARFAAYEDALGDRFIGRVLPDSAANPDSPMKNPHSVVTIHLIDEAGQPTAAARDEILEFFHMRLSD